MPYWLMHAVGGTDDRYYFYGAKKLDTVKLKNYARTPLKMVLMPTF